jgi:two-component system nitrogen regulation response regulator NtrX
VKTVLVVDDERGIREVLDDILTDEGYEVFSADNGLEALRVLDTELIDCVLLDVWLPGKGGLEVLEEVRERYTRVPVILISGHGNIDMAVRAVKQGAFDFLEKPLSLERVTTIVRNAIEIDSLRRENARLKGVTSDGARLVGTSAPIAHVRSIVEQTSGSDARVLITGENGTGKEVCAREIHQRSARRGGPFVAVNCAAIPDTLIESELFGHERGAFTGAAGARKGKFELAHTGTLFLDEVADMSAGAQAKVLRVIQEMRFERLGGEDSISVDVRIIAATNKDIGAEIAEGRFREDLYFRLNVIPIDMPALRERKEDIPLLVEAFLREHGREFSFDRSALDALREYPWPGNVRELKNFVERVTIMVDHGSVSREDLEQFLGDRASAARRSPLGEFLHLSLADARERFERQLLAEKLREHEFNVSRTAQDLGIYPSNLHAKIKKLGIEVER